MAGEVLAARVLTQHNLHFFASLMERLRAAIRDGTGRSWGVRVLETMRTSDEVGPPDNGGGGSKAR